MESTIYHDDIDELAEMRMAICRKCGLYQKGLLSNEPICSSKRYINKETNEVSRVFKPGYVSGCGCALNYKVYNIKAKCPINKW